MTVIETLALVCAIDRWMARSIAATRGSVLPLRRRPDDRLARFRRGPFRKLDDGEQGTGRGFRRGADLRQNGLQV